MSVAAQGAPSFSAGGKVLHDIAVIMTWQICCLLFGGVCSGAMHAIEEDPPEFVHGVTIYVVSGLIAITCSAGLMLHTRRPWSLIN